MDDKLGSNITDSVERVLRYIIPGVAFCLLFALSHPAKFGTIISTTIPGSGLSVFLVILTVGMSIYVIHSQIIRFTLELIVFIKDQSPVNVFSSNKCLYNYSESVAKLIISRGKSQNYPKAYYTYLWSIVHYSFIMSYLLIFFALFNEKDSWVDSNTKLIAIVGVFIFVLSFCSYWKMQVLEKDTITILNANETASKECENRTI
ncbi:MAG: hypothetical protein KAT52_05080 [Desulfobacterales bacterium]|nr:hypothetical protein [Desulfobacterales bacterium]